MDFLPCSFFIEDQLSLVAGSHFSFLFRSFAWSVVPSLWKHSIAVPVFQRLIIFASCFFKLLKQVVHSRISPHISPPLDESQGGFRRSDDLLVVSLVSILSSHSPLFLGHLHSHPEGIRHFVGQRDIGSSV